MTLRRKIAELLRGWAASIDDTPRGPRAEIEARLAAAFAIPRRVNRYVQRTSFSNDAGHGASILDNPMVVAAADVMERAEPGLYAGNPDMVAAIAQHRAGRQ